MKFVLNTFGPTPIDTDLIKNVPGNKIEELKNRQCIKRLGNFEDVKNDIHETLKMSP